MMLAATEAAAGDAPQPLGVFTVSITNGLVTTFQDGPATVWVVSPAGFSFSVVTTIPTTEVDLEAPSGTSPTVLEASQLSKDGANYFVAIRPMKANVSKSALSITVNDDEHSQVLPLAQDFDYKPVLTGVPAAKWGKPLVKDADPEMNELLAERLLGIQGVAPKAPTLTPTGPAALSMVVETTFTYDVVDEASPDHLPLQVTAVPPEKPPVVDTAAPFSTVKSTLMASPVVQARNDVFDALLLYGVDPGTNGDLTTFASDPGAYLTDNPLLEAPA
jgi:hypothetical protein